MTRPTTVPRIATTIATAVGLACVCLALLALGASANAETVTYEHESEQAFHEQLSSRQIQSATINKRLRTIRITLTDGRHVLARYPPHHEPVVVSELRARGVTTAILSPSVAKSEADKKPVHHKLRYIAGGILIAVIVVVGAVLLINRRREARAD